MTSADELLSTIDDLMLGKLCWNEAAWLGAVHVGTHLAHLVIDLDPEDIRRAQQLESIKFAKALCAKFLKTESSLRRQCAQEIAEAAGSQAPAKDWRRYLSEVSLAAAALKPQVLLVAFPEGGHFEYLDASAKFYGKSIIVVRFRGDGGYEEAEVSDPR